jgi:hypothetical protein
MKTLTLTMLDHDDISHLVLEAKANGAVAENVPGDPDHFTLTFAKAAAANAFEKAVEKRKAENGGNVEPDVVMTLNGNEADEPTED